MMHYVITYDIKDDQRRKEVFKILKGYATHVQYSVFETYIDEEALVVLKYKLRQAILAREDSVFFYRQCGSCQNSIERIGIPTDVFGLGDIIV